MSLQEHEISLLKFFFICREECIKNISSHKNGDLFSSVFKKIFPGATNPTFQDYSGIFLQFWEGALGPFRLGKLAW